MVWSNLMPKLVALRESPQYVKVIAIFAITSFIAIFATTGILGRSFANHMATHMMMRDAVVAMEMLNSIARVEEEDPFSQTRIDETGDELADSGLTEFFVHVSRLPHVFRANVYASTSEVLWSSDAELIGQTFQDNAELRAVLETGVLHPEIVEVTEEEKREHAGLPGHLTEFIELYIPIWAPDDSGRVVGAVELYKAPESLMAIIHRTVVLAWGAALFGGAILFIALISVMIYTTRILRRQEQRLIETEKLAVVGEMASAVAHGLRNPLAAIRSCAELAAEDDLPGENRAVMHDIIDQVDRLESWIRSFLTRARSDQTPADPSGGARSVPIDGIVRRCLSGFDSQMRARGITATIRPGDPREVAASGTAELEQVLNTILSNAIEAMKSGGRLEIGWRAQPGGRVSIEVCDTGPGLSEDQLRNLFVPFRTSKSSGLGVGLALGRQIAERLGGTLEIRNRAEMGVEAKLTIPSGT